VIFVTTTIAVARDTVISPLRLYTARGPANLAPGGCRDEKDKSYVIEIVSPSVGVNLEYPFREIHTGVERAIGKA
jgi:hypothetical protein